jgi:hypothetical protein
MTCHRRRLTMTKRDRHAIFRTLLRQRWRDEFVELRSKTAVVRAAADLEVSGLTASSPSCRTNNGEGQDSFLPPIAIVVVVMLSPLAVPVTVVIVIPRVVVIQVTAPRIPVPFEISATLPIGRDPVGLGRGRTRPVPIVPIPTSVTRVPIAFHPSVRGTR